MSLGVDTGLNGRLVPGDRQMVTMADHFDEFIMAAELANPNVWRDRIPKGVFPLYQGLSQKTNIFRGTLGPQAGLADWTAIEPSQKPVGQTPGKDACAYSPQTYTWAIDTVEFGGLRTSWRSPVFCVNDLKYTDMAKQQLALIIKAGSRVTDDVKEVFNREQYVMQAVNAGKAMVFCEGGLQYLDDASVRMSYDPTAVDADGDTYITFPATLLPKISTLNWSYLDFLRQYMQDQCPDAAISQTGGMPVYGLMIDVMDFEKMVYGDAELRQDMRWAQPQQLITGFNMGFKVYRGFALMHDMRQMRFRFNSIVSGNAVCKRTLPRRAIRPGTVGLIPEANPAYFEAELALGVIFMNQVVQILVPPTVDNMGSGMVFGPAPDFNGQWTWINEYDKAENPLKEVGYFFARFEYFVKPLIYSAQATVFLYRRCQHAIQTGCAIQSASDAVTSGDKLAAAPVAADFDATNRRVTLTLLHLLDASVGSTVSIKTDDADVFVASIAEDQNAPTYTFAWAVGATNAPTAVTELNDTTVVEVAVTA